MLNDYLPTIVNTGPWITASTLDRLRRDADAEYVLPICSIATPYHDLAQLGKRLLPPLFQEAMNDELKRDMIARIQACFPEFGCPAANARRIRVLELARQTLPATPAASLLAFSVDTAVEEHGPHLPLGTDTIQSYSVLRELADQCETLELCKPLEYGQMTWGLPFGFSIDVTAELLTRYVTGYVNALAAWKQPTAMYVVDVHGSIKHRQAIVAGLQASNVERWAFRWLHEPLAEFASARGDQHAGGVETALVNRVSKQLLDSDWWPDRIQDICSGQLSFETAVELTPDLDAFVQHVAKHALNGVVGDVRNFFAVDADLMFDRMLTLARQDLRQLADGTARQNAGQSLW